MGHKSFLFPEATGAMVGEPQSHRSRCQGQDRIVPPAPDHKATCAHEPFTDIDSISLQMSVVVANKDWETQKPTQFCGRCHLVFGGVSESCVSHLSGMVREADGALWRSIKQV